MIKTKRLNNFFFKIKSQEMKNQIKINKLIFELFYVNLADSICSARNTRILTDGYGRTSNLR